MLWAVPLARLGFYAGGALGPLLDGVRRYEVALALAARRLGRDATGTAQRSAQRALARAALRATSTPSFRSSIGLLGVLNLLSAIWPREPAMMRELARWLPLEVTQRSRALMLFAGPGAPAGHAQPWPAQGARVGGRAVIALAVSLVSHVARAFDLHHSLVAALLLAYLIAFRGRFTARSDPASLRQALVHGAGAGADGLGVRDRGARRPAAAASAGTPATRPRSEALRSGLLIFEPGVDPLRPAAARFLGALQLAGWAARFYLLVLVLRPVILRRRQEAPPAEVARAVREHGRHSLSALAAQQDKHHLSVAAGRGLVAYAVRGHVAFAAGDPLCADADREAAARDWLEHCRRNGWTPCVYEAAEERRELYRGLGLRALKMAEEAIVELPSFSLSGGARAALRSMVHKVMRQGLQVRRYDRHALVEPALDAQLEEISREWLAERRLGELGFSLGRFSLGALDDRTCSSPRTASACSPSPPGAAIADGRAALLDLMRRRKGAPSGTMDLLVSRALEELRALDLEEASLANAPLANVSGPRGSLEKGVTLVFEHLNAFYGYRNLFQFKKKFAPRWEGRYLVYPRGELPQVAYALAHVHGAGGLRRLVLGR